MLKEVFFTLFNANIYRSPAEGKQNLNEDLGDSKHRHQNVLNRFFHVMPNQKPEVCMFKQEIYNLHYRYRCSSMTEGSEM